VNTRSVAFVLPSFNGGGSQRVLLTFLAHLDRARFAPNLIVFNDCGPLAKLCPQDVPLQVLRRSRLRTAFPSLFWALARRRPEVIFSTMGYVNLALLAMRPLLPGRPSIVIREPNTPSASLPQLAYGNALRLGYRAFYPRADRIICQSRLIADELMRQFRVPAERIAYLANPVDVATIRIAVQQPERWPGKGRRLVAAGRLTYQKGFDRLLDMVAQLPSDTHLTILGDGPELGALCDQASRLGIAERVRFGGFREQPWALYAGADAFVLPSRWEGLPNAALEALACGTPVIATPESGGLVEIEDAAPEGAVTLVGAGQAFLAALHRIRLVPPSAVRDSLLPPGFDIAQIMPVFARVLGG